MIVYEATKQEFLSDVFDDQLVNNITRNYNSRIGKINKSEVRSWDNSMQYMYRILSDDTIPNNAGVAIEFKIPYTSKRVDFLISGKAEYDKNSVVIIELKQWEKIEKVAGKEAIVKTAMNRGLVETTHPSYQAMSYAMLIQDYNENIQNDKINLYPCSYLHNYIDLGSEDPLTDEMYRFYVDQAPTFVKGSASKLRSFIKRYIKFGDNKENLYKIENGRIRPSKSLQDALANMLAGNEEFMMIDEQKVTYETAIQLINDGLRTDTKQIMIVEGGPGTGKSVLAINLLVALTKKNLVAQYVTKNAAPRNVYANKLKGTYRKTHIDNLFKGSGSYTNSEKDEFDILIVDEAHRLNEKSGMFQNLGENQTKEIINASKLAVFFIDERQKVTLKDAGSIDIIKKFAMEQGACLTTTKLESQFRCNGSDGYIAWLDDALQIRDTANKLHMGSSYDFRIFDDPSKLKVEIERLNNVKNKSRMVAGYCWNWVKEGRSDSSFHDIEIEEFDFAMSWNLNNTHTWAIDEASVKEIGCIHTCQGLEFDYVGVIIGDDLTYRNGAVVTDHTKRAKTDKSLFGLKKMLKENPEEAEKVADEIIRNTYRTLMTRGQKGCFIYCTDKALENYFRKRLAQTSVVYGENEFFKSESIVAEKNETYN